MSRYNENFTLNPKEIDLIEHAIREQISRLSTANLSANPVVGSSHDALIKDLHELLGKLHNKKIWYGQVHETGVPLG